MAIKTFKDKQLKILFEKGSKKGIQAKHVKKIVMILDRLEAAARATDMNFPGSDFHSLKGDLKEFYSVSIEKNWKIIFRFANGEARDVELIDYH